MKTPKEKAEELVNKYIYIVCLFKHAAIKCALITVDELIKETGAKYWYDVKKEIELL